MSCSYGSRAASRRSSGLQRSQSCAAPGSAGAGAGASAGGKFQSQVEQAVINAQQPIDTNERETVQAGQYRGIYLNKSEVDQFRGPIPVEQYQIHDDPNPEVIRKRLNKLKYKQEVAVRYLNPPPGPKPGDLIVREKQSTVPPGPPIVLRQEGQGASTPTPQVYREAPPPPPPCIPEQTVEIEGCPVPPPPRRVVVEKLSNLPPKPQNVLIEKWLPYKPQKRRVVYQKSCSNPAENPRNLVIEWEAPEAEVEKVCKNLGVVDADPEEYVRLYGSELKQSCEIPDLCPNNSCPQPPSPPQQQCAPPPPPPPSPPQQQCGCQQAAPTPKPPTPKPATPAPACGCGNNNNRGSSRASNLPELEGDVNALRRVDLDKYGLGGYRRYL